MQRNSDTIFHSNSIYPFNLEIKVFFTFHNVFLMIPVFQSEQEYDMKYDPAT